MKTFIAFMLLGACLVLPAAAQSVDDSRISACEKPTDAATVEARIRACTDLIEDSTSTNARIGVAYRLRGIAHAFKKDHDLAIDDYTQSIRLLPNDGAGYFNRGLEFAEKGEHDRAILDFDETIKRDPKDHEAFYARAISHWNKRDFGNAIKDYSEAIRLKPDYVDAIYSRAVTYADDGQVDSALRDYDEALRLKPDDAEAYYGRGMVLRMKKEYDRAIADFDQAIKIAPNHAAAFGERGFAYLKKGQFDKAIADYDDSIRIDPEYAGIYADRARANYQLGKFDLAVGDLRTAAAKDSTDPYAPLWLYIVEMRLGRADAQANLRALSARIDKSTNGWAAIALFLGEGTPEQTLAQIKETDPKKKSEQECEIYYYLAHYYLLRGDKDRAMDYFKRTVATNVADFIEYEGAVYELKRLGAQ